MSQGGNVLGNGSWLNAGGNQGVTWGGLTAPNQKGGGPFDDPDGGQSYVNAVHDICSLFSRFYTDYGQLLMYDALSARSTDCAMTGY